MQLISNFNQGFRFLLCVIDIYSNYDCVIPLKGITITNAFQKILKESNRKQNKIWIDTGSESYNRSMKSWLEKNCIEIYSAHNEGKSVIAERLIRTFKTKIYKYINSVSKNIYIDKLDDIVHTYYNTCHKTIKMKPADVKSNTYTDSSKEINNKYTKFKIGNIVRISKYKNIFAKGYTPNWSEVVFVIKKVKNTVPWTYGIIDLKGEEIVGTFYKKELQKTNQKEFRIENVIKRKGEKLYVKWKGCNNLFNSCISEKDRVWMIEYFPEPKSLGEVKVELDLSNYET